MKPAVEPRWLVEGQPADAVAMRHDLTAERTAAARRSREAAELAQRHRPLAAFTLGARVEITAPKGLHRPLAGRSGVVVQRTLTGSAWVRVELPEGRVADYCLAASECSAEVAS